MHQIKDYEQLALQLKGLDIGVFIANAGVAHFGPFNDLTTALIEETVSVNCL